MKVFIDTYGCAKNEYDSSVLAASLVEKGCSIVDEVENLARERAKRLFGCTWANVQPHSGAQANMAVTMACLKPGDTFMGLDLSQGGHLTHGSPVPKRSLR